MVFGCYIFYIIVMSCQSHQSLLHTYTLLVIEKPGFALPIAIVAKCEEIINLAQKILIWRQLLAKEKSQAKKFVWRLNVSSGKKSLPRAV